LEKDILGFTLFSHKEPVVDGIKTINGYGAKSLSWRFS
jgi:hypothetical protein